MVRPRVTRLLWQSCGIILLITVGYFPLAKTLASLHAPATVLRGAGKPLVDLQNPHSLKLKYTGPEELVSALQDSANVRPVSMTAADFDSDGAEDLVTGYNTARGAVVALVRGNPEAFPRKDHPYPKAMQGITPATFLSSAALFSVPGYPDFLAAGDFTQDGRKDLLVATKGGNLYLLAGNGRGNLGAPAVVANIGDVTALAVSVSGDVAVAMDGPQGSRLAILMPGPEGLTLAATYTLPAAGSSIAWGNLGSGSLDLAAIVGNSLFIAYDAVSFKAQTETLSFGFTPQAIALGDFIADKDNRTEIAALGTDGAVHILQHGILDTTPASATAANANPAPKFQDATALGIWMEARQLASLEAITPEASVMQSHRLTGTLTPDLLVVDAASRQLKILDTSGKAANPQAAIEFPGMPLAAYVTPVKWDGTRDVVALTSSQLDPLVVTASESAVSHAKASPLARLRSYLSSFVFLQMISV